LQQVGQGHRGEQSGETESSHRRLSARIGRAAVKPLTVS